MRSWSSAGTERLRVHLPAAQLRSATGGTAGREDAKNCGTRRRESCNGEGASTLPSRPSRLRVPPFSRSLPEQRNGKTNPRRTEDERKKGNSGAVLPRGDAAMRKGVLPCLRSSSVLLQFVFQRLCSRHRRRELRNAKARRTAGREDARGAMRMSRCPCGCRSRAPRVFASRRSPGHCRNSATGRRTQEERKTN